jgi:hypothetical protein
MINKKIYYGTGILIAGILSLISTILFVPQGNCISSNPSFRSFVFLSILIIGSGTVLTLIGLIKEGKVRKDEKEIFKGNRIDDSTND